MLKKKLSAWSVTTLFSLSLLLLLLALPSPPPLARLLPPSAANASLPCPPPYSSSADVLPSLPRCAAALGELAAAGSAPLVHSPDTTTLRKPASVALDVVPCSTFLPPVYSVVVSAHNAARLLPATLAALLRHTLGAWELILVLDGCSDASLAAATRALNVSLPTGAWGGLVRVRVLLHPTPVWETSSDNSGLALAHAQSSVAVLVQPDQHVSQRGWNVALSLPIALFPDVWAVSGRDAHNAAAGRGEGSEGFNLTAARDLATPLGDEMLAQQSRTFWIRDAVNRGPLALALPPLRRLGFLNERDFLIRRDDHDLMLRAYLQLGLKCGKYAVGFVSPPREGASRQKGRLRSRNTREWLFLLYRTARRSAAARRAPRAAAAAANGGRHWNEARPVPGGAMETALAEAERLTGELRCEKAHGRID